MQILPEDKNLPSEEKLLAALAKELKSPLILIARQAELEKTGRDAARALDSIQKTAENALQLLDSYLLAARSEYGQVKLPLETVGIGSVIYEVTNQLAPYIRAGKLKLSTEVKNAEVTANRKGLAAALRCSAELMIALQTKQKTPPGELLIRTDKDKDMLLVSILGQGIEVKNRDIAAARRTMNSSFLAGGKLFDSGVRLAIADILANALGTSLKVRRIDGLKGLSFELPRSTQLRLVSL